MRPLLFAVACILLASCEDILPVENVDLCEGDAPSSPECEQCKARPIPASCPQCRGGEGTRDAQCVNANSIAGASSGSGAAGDSGAGGMGDGSGTGGGSAGTSQSGTGGSEAGSGGGGSAGSDSGTGGSDAGSGGSGGGGSGGSVSEPECNGHGDCSGATPQCSAEQECVPCTKSAACTGREEGERCDNRATSANQGRCVACLTHDDCDDITKPQCNSKGQCVGCTSDDACHDRTGTPRCDTTGAATGGGCVQCLMNTDCGVESPECKSDRTCGACTTNEACTGRPGAQICDGSGVAPYDGTCVQCTVDEEWDCGDDVCTPSTRTCAVGHEKLSQDTCETCVADSECMADRRCIPMKFDGADRANAYCLKQYSTGCERPYTSEPIDRASVSGAAAEDYCGIDESKSSCEAVLALISGATCPSSADVECGADGAVCRNVNGGANRCTYLCSIAANCPNTAACNSGYCGGPP